MSSKVLIVDDHPLVRQGLRAILGCDPAFEIIGEAETVEEALDAVKNLQPDLVLTDLRLYESNGLNIIEQVQNLDLSSKFVILTSSTNEQDFLRAEQLGVSGYLLKEALPEEIIHALKIINKGRKYYDPVVLEIKMKGETLLNEELTPREKEVLMALGKGLNNRDIASLMYVSENTVKKHVSQILAKLNLADRTQAAIYAYSRGLVQSQ